MIGNNFHISVNNDVIVIKDQNNKSISLKTYSFKQFKDHQEIHVDGKVYNISKTDFKSKIKEFIPDKFVDSIINSIQSKDIEHTLDFISSYKDQKKRLSSLSKNNTLTHEDALFILNFYTELANLDSTRQEKIKNTKDKLMKEFERPALRRLFEQHFVSLSQQSSYSVADVHFIFKFIPNDDIKNMTQLGDKEFAKLLSFKVDTLISEAESKLSKHFNSNTPLSNIKPLATMLTYALEVENQLFTDKKQTKNSQPLEKKLDLLKQHFSNKLDYYSALIQKKEIATISPEHLAIALLLGSYLMDREVKSEIKNLNPSSSEIYLFYLFSTFQYLTSEPLNNENVKILFDIHNQLTVFFKHTKDKESFFEKTMVSINENLAAALMQHTTRFITQLPIENAHKIKYTRSKMLKFFELKQLLRDSQNPALSALELALENSYQNIKAFVKQHPHFRAATASAQVGEAATVGVQAAKAAVHTTRIEEYMQTSLNEVIPIPELKVLYKKTGKNLRSSEDENNVQHLFSLLKAKTSLLFSKAVGRLSPSKVGIILSYEEEKRARVFANLLPPALHSILKTVKAPHLEILGYFNKAGQYYAAYIDKIFKVQTPDKILEITYEQLRTLYENNRIQPNTLFVAEGGKHYVFQRFFAQNPGLIEAIQFDPEFYKGIRLIPTFTSSEERVNFEKQENKKWTYRAKDGTPFENVSFKELQDAYLNSNFIPNLATIHYFNSPEPVPLQDLTNALNITWQVIFPEPLSKNTTPVNERSWDTPVYAPISHVKTKRFIPNLFEASSLVGNQKFENAVISKLNPSVFFDAVKTAEIQFMDLHRSNVGFALTKSAEVNHYENKKFKLSGKVEEVNFKTLVFQYLSEVINDKTVVTFTEGEETIHKKIGDVDDLKSAINGPWEMILFDTDLTIGETNTILRSREGSRIPLRSCFLEMAFKDLPIPQSVLEELIHSRKADARVIKWMENRHSPIRKRLLNELQDALQKLLNDFYQHPSYQLSRYRNAEGKQLPFSKVQQLAMKHLIINSDIQVNSIWSALQEMLSTVKIGKRESLESITKRYHTATAEELLTLEPPAIKEGEVGYEEREDYKDYLNKVKQQADQMALTLQNESAEIRQLNKEVIDSINLHALFAKGQLLRVINEEGTIIEISAIKGTSLSSLSKQYAISTDQLIDLNLGRLVQKLKIRPQDLTSNTAEAIERRQKIARQLTPNVSVAQKTAYQERMSARQKYLENYLTVKKSKATIKEEIESLISYLNDPTTPVTSFYRNEKLTLLRTVQTHQKGDIPKEKFYAFKHQMMQHTQPTYFNVAKSMYPYLADAYRLNEILNLPPYLTMAAIRGHTSLRPGEMIGYFRTPLERNVEKGIRASNAEAKQLAQVLKYALENEPHIFI